jgi:hypothetical protein
LSCKLCESLFWYQRETHCRHGTMVNSLLRESV